MWGESGSFSYFNFLASPISRKELLNGVAPPPSEPCRRISRTRLSSRWLSLITSKRIDRPVHELLLSYTAPDPQRKHCASVGDLNHDHVPFGRCVSGGCFSASSESSRPARRTSSCSCA